ncbi:stage II sporulation protein M [Salinibacillus xinjiangensis]|uniref:Stage II sporulation protein M n=1 Tax=Salinibacillus xinjiangensis TaxID=1229268 RepID=A0A6G1X6C5_9BACI|nr:stage II sporulation protein M [Salinibacillus xinjiangensis]MRG86479.1 stage II sporulation protein M [Salinibacillus xinjiangensis]
MLKRKNIRSNIQLNEYSSIYVFMFVLFLIGIIFGAIIVNSMNTIQKLDLFFYLHQFFEDVKDGSGLEVKELFQSSFFYHFKYILLIFILGLSIIGIPIIWLFIFMKGIVIGFSVGFLVNQMGWHGLLMATASVAPHNVFLIPAYLIAGSFAMIFSLHLIRRLFSAKIYQQSIRKHITQYSTVLIVVMVVALIGSIVETFISPNAMRIIVDWAL